MRPSRHYSVKLPIVAALCHAEERKGSLAYIGHNKQRTLQEKDIWSNYLPRNTIDQLVHRATNPGDERRELKASRAQSAAGPGHSHPDCRAVYESRRQPQSWPLSPYRRRLRRTPNKRSGWNIPLKPLESCGADFWGGTSKYLFYKGLRISPTGRQKCPLTYWFYEVIY